MMIDHPEKHPQFNSENPDSFWDGYFRQAKYYNDGITLADALCRYRNWLQDNSYPKKQIVWKLQRWAITDEVRKIMTL